MSRDRSPARRTSGSEATVGQRHASGPRRPPRGAPPRARRRAALLGGLLVALGAATSAGLARGQGAPPPAEQAAEEPSAADKETARNLVAVGDQRYEARDYQGALEAYQGADAIMAVPTTGIEVGRALIALAKLVEARDKLLEISRYPVRADEPTAFTKARRRAADLAADLAERIPSMEIELRGLPAGTEAEVRVDDVVVKPATVGLPRKLNPGPHPLKVTAAGYHTVDIVVELKERQRRVVEIPLRTSAAPPPVEPAPDTSPVAYAGFAIGAVGLVVGTITGAVSLSIASDVTDQCVNDVCPSSVEADADRSLSLAHVSTVSFVLAGVGAGLGILGLTVFADDEPSTTPTGARVEPWVGLGAGGLRGAF